MKTEWEITEREITSIIEGYRPDQYDDVISEAENWGLFYHLSSLRNALLCWYPFQPQWHVLEPDAGFGALTGCLADRCASVTALSQNPSRAAACRRRFQGNDRIEVLETDVYSLPELPQYDCVVLVDQLEKNAGRRRQLFQACKARLKPDGILLVSFQNRFGLKYLCGAMDHRVKSPFKNMAAGASRLMSRKEVEDLAGDAGFTVSKWYYPMPDAFYAQAIYTDAVKNVESVRDRVFAYDPFSSPRIAQEAQLYDDVIHAGLLPELSSSYFVEFRMKPDSKAPDVEFALLSTDRGAEHGFATVCYGDGWVEKRSIWPEGIPSLQRACENLDKLAAQGILTVPQTWTGSAIRMPRIREESLLAHIRGQMTAGPEAVFGVFEALRTEILRSSSTVELEDGTCWRDWRVSREDIGPVLSEGMIDMIPYNAFWADGRIRFYDQEFCVENCPVGYIMFRAVFYTWIHIPELEKVLPKEEIKARLGIAKCWDAYNAREMAFVEDNRKRVRFRQVYRWADRANDTTYIRRNLSLLMEADAMPRRSEPLKDVHRVQLDLLKKLDRVCRENGLSYFAMHGTLLGAVRHGGFIPWDDDVDIAMPREDYDQLIALAPGAFEEPYFLQTPENDVRCFYGGYAKLRNSLTTAIEPQNRGRRCNQGIWIDIFPLDRCPSREGARLRLQRRIGFWQRTLLAKHYRPEQGMISDVDPKCLSLYYLFGRCLFRRWILRRLDRLFRSGGKGDRLSILACYYGARANQNVYLADAFSEPLLMPFEDIQIPVPRDYDRILAARYGSRYMELPNRLGQYAHNDVIFSVDHPWWEQRDM